MTQPLAEMLAKRFIARRDVKAVQGADGQYRPDRQRNPATGRPDGPDLPWTMANLYEHLSGAATYGHYLLDAASHAKLFVFDVDLRNDPTGTWVWHPDLSNLGEIEYPSDVIERWFVENTHVYPINPREVWRDRSHQARPWLKFQMRAIAEKLSQQIRRELGIPVACAYTGNKGVHVYGFTGYAPASEVRAAANVVMSSLPTFTSDNNQTVWRDTDTDPAYGFGNFTVEVYPKQDQIDEGKYGNLCRLPLGVNRKNPADPCFFLDQRREHHTLVPHPDPIALLTNGDPWT